MKSNLNSIEDFKYLLAETKKEHIPFKEISVVITSIEEAFEQAKQNIQAISLKRN